MEKEFMFIKDQLSQAGISATVDSQRQLVTVCNQQFDVEITSNKPLYTNEKLSRSPKSDLVIFADMFGFDKVTVLKRIKSLEFSLKFKTGKELIYAYHILRCWKKFVKDNPCGARFATKAILKDFIYTSPLNHYPTVILRNGDKTIHFTNIIRQAKINDCVTRLMKNIFKTEFTQKEQILYALEA